MKNIFNITNKIAIVTGGLGQLGSQFSNCLLANGAKVAIFNRNIPNNADLTINFPIDSNDLIFIRADVSNKSSLIKGLGHVENKWGTPDILINNAGIDSQPNASSEENGPFEYYPEKTWDKVLNVNLKGIFLCCQVIGGAMAMKRKGSIINICSIYGLISPKQSIYEYRHKQGGKPFYKPVAYSASKSGILNMTRYLATYWGKSGVRVNTLTPAGVFRSAQDKEFIKNYCELVPMGRMANEDEYNGAILFLASAASSYMTGSNLIIDGGFTAW
jgi:NAD(P)-dependent dehydrogenase (short-subunit alcohol dehydrogenase family)